MASICNAERVVLGGQGGHEGFVCAFSEGGNGSGVRERAVKSRPIKAQSAGIARAMASICNAERVVFGGQGGHEGFVHTFSAHQALDLPGYRHLPLHQRGLVPVQAIEVVEIVHHQPKRLLEPLGGRVGKPVQAFHAGTIA